MKKRILILAMSLLIGGCAGNNNPSADINTTNSSITSTIPITTNGEITSNNTPTSTITPSTPTPTTTTPSTPTPSTSISGSSSSTTITVPMLTKPSLIIDNETGVVSWNSIANATHYNYIINDGEMKTTTSTTLLLNDKSNISVQAASSESVSKWSDAVTYYNTNDVVIDYKPDIKVYFHNTDYEPLSLKAGDLVTKPADPIKEFSTFDNWYSDPFHECLFDFTKPVYESTIVYASFNKDTIINDVYFWIKANNLITSATQKYYDPSDWKFIPLQRNEKQSEFIEYKATISVTGTSEDDKAAFVIMDGFSADSGRNYFKDNGSDFKISEDGIYDIYFSAEHEYSKNVNAYIVKSNNTASTKDAIVVNKTLSTPAVNIDSENNIARWDEISNATEYEIILNNLAPIKTSNNYISLEKRTHISVRALNDDNTSSWSIPKANINYIYESKPDKTYAYVYFLDSNLDSIKVNINQEITAPEDNPTFEGATFEGWYLDIALQEKATFPYKVTDNIVFYPKWSYEENIFTKEYYVLTDESGNRVGGLTWNTDNYDYYEYETDNLKLTANAEYYIKRTNDDSKSWGPYTVKSNGGYKIYFSEEHLWAVGTEKERNIYIQSTDVNIYFTNNKHWSGTIYAYTWNKSSNTPNVSWPGEAMEEVKTNSYGETIYKIQVNLTEYDMIIFNNHNNNQTVDISLSDAYDGLGYYVSGGSGKSCTCSTYKFE